ncbi:MAG: alanine--tRNA ligase [Phycisphaerales bacterium]|nr:alanine--tRNA ligase [Phycisphaerales bacterium]
MRTAAQIRQDFLDFFMEKHGHSFVPSSPVIPHDDPTLLFANAGMNQFKPCFLGTAPPGSELARLTRATNSQKCIRAGGKHNDLDDVGKDTYHHTFFEMLGNWSFGDYFKKEAIAWAWDLLTNVWGLDKRRLYATVFGGDEALGLPPDEEAEALWKSETDIDPSHVRRFGTKDNFWEMGETGPCGPCSEIHYDGTPNLTGGDLVNADHPDTIEIWNLVFIQYDRQDDGSLRTLPAKHVDTGMGFERMVRILQNKTSNYETDLWSPIFAAIQKATGTRPYGGELDDPTNIAYRIIADHIRTLTLAITDGAPPSNEGRGYVLRRILRRAVRHSRQTLGVKGVFFADLVPAVVDSLGDAFPELRNSPDAVMEILREEEESFGRTLDRGIALFEEAASHPQAHQSRRIPADAAFKLHDTYGFPIDLTEIMAQERGMSVDLAGYEKLMGEARDRARAAGLGEGAAAHLSLPAEAIGALRKEGIAATDDSPKFDATQTQAVITSIWDGTQFVERVEASDQHIAVLTDRTTFYAAMGGQVADTGTVAVAGGKLDVIDTQTAGEYILHIGTVTSGKLHVGDTVTTTVDANRRSPIMANHTGTHLLNLALRTVLGDRIEQKGSLVADDRLRFDFSHSHALSHDELTEVQHLVNQDINAALTVHAQDVPLDRAKKVQGVRAVFGEVYPDPVRVVSIGVPVAELIANPHHEKWRQHSIEFCGGTHLQSTADADGFVIVSEEAVAKGIRRIVAVTGSQASDARDHAHELRRRLYEAEKLPVEALAKEAQALARQLDSAMLPAGERMELRGVLSELQAKVKAVAKTAAAGDRDRVLTEASKLADAATGEAIVLELPGAVGQTIRNAMDVFKSKHPDSAILLASGDEEAGKVAIIARVPEALIKRGLKAGDWVRTAAQACGGKGGGRPDSAQAGGKELCKLPEALDAAIRFAHEKLR